MAAHAVLDNYMHCSSLVVLCVLFALQSLDDLLAAVGGSEVRPSQMLAGDALSSVDEVTVIDPDTGASSDLKKVVLARSTRLQCAGDLRPLWVLEALQVRRLGTHTTRTIYHHMATGCHYHKAAVVHKQPHCQGVSVRAPVCHPGHDGSLPRPIMRLCRISCQLGPACLPTCLN